MRIYNSLSVVLFILIFILYVVVAQAADHNANSLSGHGRSKGAFTPITDPFEPTITRKESDLLNAAVQKAHDEPEAAVAMLRDEITEKTSPALDFALGNFYYQGGELENAEEAYRAAIAKLPNFRSALNNLARVYISQDRPVEAMQMFQSLVRDGQGDAQSLLLLGHCLLLQDKAVQAEGAYRQSLMLAPDESYAMRGLIKSLIEQQRNAEVLSLTRDLQTQFPYDAELWNLRANAHLSLDQFGEAIGSLETARLLEAVTASMLATLGDLYLNRAQPREAISAYQQAFSQMEPSVDHMLQATQGFLILEALEQAEQLLHRIKELESQSPLSPEHRQRSAKLEARLALLQGRLEDAAARFETIIREDPLDGDAMLALAALRMTLEQVEDARMLFERAARINGYEANALVQHAQLEVGRGRYRSAVALLERAQVFEEQSHITRYLEQLRRLTEQ
jgi:tetratricopeptide (TPR) repeat protein